MLIWFIITITIIIIIIIIIIVVFIIIIIIIVISLVIRYILFLELRLEFKIWNEGELFLSFKELNLFNPLDLRSGQHLISPYSYTTESFIKITRIKEMIAYLRGSDCQTNSPCQSQRKWIEKIYGEYGHWC